MATFPAYAKVLAGFKRQRDSIVSRTDTEDGMTKQLRTKARALVKRPVVIQLSSFADYNNFLTWFQDDIDHGAAWFDWTDPVDSTLKSTRFMGGLLEEEDPITLDGTIWRIRATLETWGT